jgi:hypothetical protein
MCTAIGLVIPNDIIAHLGAVKFETPEQGGAARAKWKAWVGSLDEAVVNPGTSLVRGKLVSSDGASERGANFALQLAHPVSAPWPQHNRGRGNHGDEVKSADGIVDPTVNAIDDKAHVRHVS